MPYMIFRASNTTLKAVIFEASKNTKVIIFQYRYHINITNLILYINLVVNKL